MNLNLKDSQNFVPWILRKNGYQHQALKAVEEMSKLSELLVRYANEGELDLAHIIEETSDVELMLRQVKEMFGMDDVTVEQQIQYKINRYLEGNGGGRDE